MHKFFRFSTFEKMLSKLSSLSDFFSDDDGLVLFPALNARESSKEKFVPKHLKCGARNCAFLSDILAFNNRFNANNIPRIMVIDSAANNSIFHLVAGFIDKGVDIVTVSNCVSWDAYDDGHITVTPFSETLDAYTSDMNMAFDGIFLDACGNAPLLLGDICGINVEGRPYVSAFESLHEEGGTFGITWSNTRFFI